MAANLFSNSLILLYLASFFNFLSLALTIVSVVGKVCLVLGGTTTTVNTTTSFVTVTSYFLSTCCKLLFAKYDTSLSDHVGRKPIMVLSCFAFILSRVLIMSSNSAGQFYLAAICLGCCDVFYAVSIAYLSDILVGADAEQRGKAIGIQAGLSIGMGFTIGVPVGAVLQEQYSINLPFYAAIGVSCLSVVCVLLIPAPDTLGLVHEDKMRRLPSPLKAFLIEHNPLSGIGLIFKASGSPLDWLSNFLGQVAQQILQSTFLLFVQGALHYSPSQSGEAFAFIGISIAIFSPFLIGRYEERALVSNGLATQIVGYCLLSIAGSSLPNVASFAFPAYIFLAVGGVWLSAMPSILTKQYPNTQYGSVVGVMAQQTVLAVLPAYPCSILFSYSLSHNASVKWVGSIWVISSFFLLLAIFVQIHAHSSAAYQLKRRIVTVTPSSDSSHGAEGAQDPIASSVVVNPLLAGGEIEAQTKTDSA